MAKKLLIVFLMLPIILLAQKIDRTTINGKITAPEGEDVEGVSIYNVSSQKGVVTDKEGVFEIAVAENDRVQVTAIQYQPFTVIVDKGVVDSQRMRIYLNPAVNQLEEVIVRPYDLTGNIIVDVGKIKTVDFGSKFTTDYKTVEFEYGFKDDSQSSIRGNKAREAYYNGQTQNGADIVGGIGLLAELIFGKPNKNKNIRAPEEKLAVATNLRQRFSNEYINRTFQIPEKKAGEFIYYIEDEGVAQELLKEENEIALLELLYKRAAEFKEISE